MQKIDVKDTITENPSTCLCHVIFFWLEERFQMIVPYTKMIKMIFFFINAVLSILQFHVLERIS